MARVETKLTPTADGGFTARKRIPADVREDYGRLFGKGKPQWEAWFNSRPMPIGLARAKHREWLSDIEARFANIRAERKGEGRTLSPMQARALAGEWYLWWTTRHLPHPTALKHWQDFYEQLCDSAYHGAVGVTAAWKLRQDGMRRRFGSRITKRAEERPSHGCGLGRNQSILTRQTFFT